MQMRPQSSSEVPFLTCTPIPAGLLPQDGSPPCHYYQRAPLMLPVLRALAFQHYKNMQEIKA